MRAIRPPRQRPIRVVLEGSITGLGFASGERFVLGLWGRGPLGAMQDVMWARADGTRILLASRPEAASFISGVYSFDRTEVVSFDVLRAGQRVSVTAGPLELEFEMDDANRLFSLRPRFLRRSLTWVRVEDALFRPLVGRLLLRGARDVRAYGVNKSGVRQWYRIDSYRKVSTASGAVDGTDLGSLTSLQPPLGFGFSGFPQQPAFVECSPVLEGSVLNDLIEMSVRATHPPEISGPGESG